MVVTGMPLAAAASVPSCTGVPTVAAPSDSSTIVAGVPCPAPVPEPDPDPVPAAAVVATFAAARLAGVVATAVGNAPPGGPARPGRSRSGAADTPLLSRVR